MRTTISKKQSGKSILASRLARKIALIGSIVGLFTAFVETSSAETFEVFSKFPVPRSEIYQFRNKVGKTQRIKMNYEFNHNGELEVVASLLEAHWLAKETELPILSGRDIDGDNKIETWFYNEGPIVKSFQKTTASENAWGVAFETLYNLDLDEGRWLGTLIAKNILSEVSFTVDGELKDIKELEKTQMDLQDLDYRIKGLQSKNEDPALAQELQRVSNEGWNRLLQRWNKSRVEERHQRLAGDLALFVGGGLVLKGVRFLIAKALTKEQMAVISQRLKETVNQSKLAKKLWVQKAGAKIAESGVGKNIKSFTSMTTGMAQRFETEVEAISWLSRFGVFSNVIKKIGGLAGTALKASWHERGYIIGAQTMQLAVESYNRGFWKFSDAPIILKDPVRSTKQFIENVSNDKGLIQNMSYMTLQTTLLTGITSALSKNGASMALKYAVCSMVTMIDSTTVNILIQKKSDYQRIGFDTGWELIVGGSQVQLDIALIRWGEALAHKFNRPGLRVVGYLLGTVDQMIGYTGYNVVTSKYFETGEVPKVDDPHPTEPIRPSNVDEQRRQLNEAAPVIIVPVMAPQA